MYCVILTCNTVDFTSSQKTTYFKFPSESTLRAKWLQLLCKLDQELDEDSAVCFKHFQPDDVLESIDGQLTLREGAVPAVNVQVCRICFAVDRELYPLMSYDKLHKAYETLTGLTVDNKIAPFICKECAHQLRNYSHLRTKSLEAHTILLDVYMKYNCITLESLQSVCGFQNLLTTSEGRNLSRLYNIDTELAEWENELLTDQCDSVTVDCVKLENNEIDGLDGFSCESLHDEVTEFKAFQDLDSPTFDRCRAEMKYGRIKQNVQYEKTSDILYVNKFDDITVDENPIIKDVQNMGLSPKMPSGEITLPEDVNNDIVSTSRKPDTGHTSMDEDGTTNECTGLEERKHSQEKTNEEQQVSRTNTPKEIEGSLNNNVYPCEICDFQTNIAAQLMSHLKAHAATKSYNCSSCSYKTIYKRSLMWHARVHSGEKPYSCNKCNKAYIKKSNLKVHMQEHLNEKPYICDLCNKGFSRRDSIIIHLKGHSGEKPYSCDVCNKTFAGKYQLNKHHGVHISEGPNLCICDYCNKKFTSKYSIARHMLTHSTATKTSGICDKKIKTKRKLEKQHKKHLDDSNEDRSETTAANTQNATHSKSHRVEKTFLCNICNHYFVNKCTLDRHLKTHSNIKPFSCGLCDKTFIANYYLLSHLKVHSDEKPYSCNLCQKVFKTKAYLRKHKKKHTSERPYTCDVCKKSFATRDYLLIHVRVHSGKRPYSCNICNKSFTRNDHAKKHSKIHL